MLFRLFGILSAVIFIAGDLPYVINTYKGKTKPHRVTWGIVALMNSIGFANQYASGASNSLWLFGTRAAVCIIIFLGSIRNGMGGGSKADVAALSVSLLGVVLWATLHSPIYSILASAVADISALLPTFAKAKKHPETETKIAWLVGGFSSLLATISVGKLDWKLLLLPGLAVILQAYMAYILYIQTAKHTE
jgi:hypothetical protein